MAIAEREATVVWEGSLATGHGTLSTGSEALEALPLTWASRTETPNGKTSPEELIAAAHASCFAMALALVLGQHKTPPTDLVVSARCTLDEIDGAPKITREALEVRGSAYGLDEAGFAADVAEAALLCPVSNALRGNVQLTIAVES